MTIISPAALQPQPPNKHTLRLVPLHGKSLTLSPKAELRLTNSYKPVVLFDVIDTKGNTIGGANLIIDPDGTNVLETGHIGAHLEPGYSSPETLQEIAELLIPYGRGCGLSNIRITTRLDNLPTLEACRRLGPTSEAVEPGFANLAVFTFVG